MKMLVALLQVRDCFSAQVGEEVVNMQRKSDGYTEYKDYSKGDDETQN